MMDAPARDPSHEAMAALERLYAKQVISQEEGQAAARFITGDAAFVFPPPPKASPEPVAQGGSGSDDAAKDRPSG